MPQLIAITKIGDYSQGKITPEMLREMVDSYDKDFQAAPFIPEHRKFNDKGELINNMRALGWVNTLTTDGVFLYAMPEEEHDLKWFYDGISYRYASIEIEVVQINDKPTLYCAAVAITNFPAANIPKIEFNRNKQGSRMIAAFNKISITNNNEEEMKELLIKLGKELGIEDPTEETVIAKLTEMKTEVAGIKQLEQLSAKFDGIINALTTSGSGEEDPLKAEITKLTKTVNALAAKLSALDTNNLESLIDQAIQDGKFLPAQKEILLQQYADNVEGFKAFAATAPKIQLNQSFPVPKTEGGNPLTYNDLLNNPVEFERVQKENPALFTQLKNEWLKDPSSTTEEG